MVKFIIRLSPPANGTPGKGFKESYGRAVASTKSVAKNADAFLRRMMLARDKDGRTVSIKHEAAGVEEYDAAAGNGYGKKRADISLRSFDEVERDV